MPSQYSASTIISNPAIRSLGVWNYYVVAILCEYDYIKSGSKMTYEREFKEKKSRNTLRVRLYQISTSGNPCLARAPKAKSKAHAKISDAKGQSAYFTNCAHLYLT